MKRKKAAVLILAAALLCQPVSALADAAPDGMTDASQTEAARMEPGKPGVRNGKPSKMTGLRFPCLRELMRHR